MEQVTSILPGVRELIKQSIQTYKKNYKILISIGLVPVAFYIVHNFVVTALNQNLPETSVNMIIIGLITVLFGLLSFVVQTLFYISLANAAHEIDRGNVLSLKDVYKKSSKLFFPYVWMSILLTLSIIIPTLLFIIPGFIFYLYLSFSVFALVVDDKRGLQSLAVSYYYTKGNLGKIFWRVFAVVLVATGLSVILFILAVVLFMLFEHSYDVNVLAPKFIIYFGGSNFAGMSIIAIWTFISSCIFAPILSIYGYLIYKNLKLLKPEPAQDVALKPLMSTFRILIIVGLVAVILFTGVIFALGVVSGYKGALVKNNSQLQPFTGSSVQSKFPVNSITLPLRLESLEDKPFINKELGYSINFPKKWLSEVASDGVFIYPPEGSGIMADILIGKKDLPPATNLYSGEVFMGLIVEGLLDRASSSLSNISYQKYNISDQEVYALSGMFNDEVNKNININYYFVRGESSVYMIVARAESDSWLKYQPLLINSINTFKKI